MSYCQSYQCLCVAKQVILGCFYSFVLWVRQFLILSYTCHFTSFRIQSFAMPSVHYSLFKTMILSKRICTAIVFHPQAVCPVIPMKARFYKQSNAENNKKNLEFGKFSIKSTTFWIVLLPLYCNCNNLWKKMLY